MGAPLVVFGAQRRQAAAAGGRLDGCGQGRIRRDLPRPGDLDAFAHVSTVRLDHAVERPCCVACARLSRCPGPPAAGRLGLAQAVEGAWRCAVDRRRGRTDRRRRRRRTTCCSRWRGLRPRRRAVPPRHAADAAVPARQVRRRRATGLAAAKAAGKPAMLDFYADWCVSCKEMEKFTFTDPAVHARAGATSCCCRPTLPPTTPPTGLMQRFGIVRPAGRPSSS